MLAEVAPAVNPLGAPGSAGVSPCGVTASSGRFADASSLVKIMYGSVGAKARSDLAIGMRVFHEKFGYGEIADIDGNKLEVAFEQAGSKRVLDSFIKLA